MNATLNHVFMQVCGVGVFIFFLFTVLVSSNSSGTTGEDSWKSFELCLPKDYRIASWSSCVDNQRTVIYERIQGSCTGVLSFESKIPCECQLEDYEPILEDPECGESETLSAPITAIKGWRPRVGAGCSPNIAVERSLNSTVTNAEGSVSVNCPCTEKHIGIYTTDCDAQNSSRTVIYYWNRPCSPIYIQLPSPKFISCEFTCGDGYYFDAAQGLCYTCPAGTYSGSGLMYTAPWNSLPSTFSTECEGVGCSSWMTQGDYMFSGSNFNLKNIRSTLNFMFEVSRPSAVLSITYRVSSERNRDLFKIKIRGKTALVDSGVSASWKTFNATIEDYADICPWNIKWTRYGQTYEYCLLRTKITPPSSRLVAALQENSRAFHYDHILIPEQSGCEWPMYERPMKWKAGDRVLVFVPVGGCSIEKKISFAQRAKMDAVVIVTEQFAHQVDILTDPEILQEFPLFILNLDMTVFLDAISRSDRPWFNYKKVPPLGPIQVELLYEKDDSASLGADHVLIKEIQVDAPKDALGSYKCFACPPGTSSVEGSSSCVMCPVNTYSADYQSSACTPCPDGYISESGSTECAPVHDCALDDFFPIEESGCHLSKSSTRSLERVVTYQPVEPIRCNDPDKALRTLSPKTFQCASCPEGFILNSSDVCTPCLNGMGTSPEGDRCIQCPSNKAIYPVSSYVGFSALGGSFPPSWTTSCDFCNTVGWRFVPYYQNVNLGQSVGNVATGIGVGGSFFTEGKAVLEVPFELSNFGDLFFTYSYSESSEEGSVVTFQIVNPTEQTPDLSIIAIEENPSGASTYASSKLRPGQYVARWTYFKDIKPSHQKSSSPVNVTHPSLSSFIIRTLTFRGDRNGTGTCQECLVGHSCEAGLLKPCLAGTYSGVETEYKCIPCPEKSISEIGDARCRACPLGSKPSADRRVCELFESNVSYPHGRHQYVWSYTPAVFGPVHLDLDHDASPHSPSADRESEQTLFVLNSYNSTEFRDVAARFPLDFNMEVYGPSVYVISSDNVMRIGNLKSMQVVEKIGSNTTNYVFDNATGNVTLPVTDLHFESDFPCEADHSLHVSANVFYHCNITHSRPWISASNYEPNKCLYNIHVHFQQACPQCFNIYAVRSTSECVNGMHDVYKKYVAKDTNACYDERVMAPGVYLTEFCTLSDQIETRSGLISIVALVTTILCAIILFFALFIYRKHRKLYETYQSLTTRGAPRDGYHINDDEIKEMNAHIPRGVVID